VKNREQIRLVGYILSYKLLPEFEIIMTMLDKDLKVCHTYFYLNFRLGSL